MVCSKLKAQPKNVEDILIGLKYWCNGVKSVLKRGGGLCRKMTSNSYVFYIYIYTYIHTYMIHTSVNYFVYVIIGPLVVLVVMRIA